MILFQGNKNQMVPMGMGGGLGSKSPNLQSSANAVQQQQQSSLANSLGGAPMGNSMVMSIASNGNQQPMSSMQGK